MLGRSRSFRYEVRVIDLGDELVVRFGRDLQTVEAVQVADDRIAPSPCAEALPRAIPAARILRPRTGHVGMIMGSSAEADVWTPLAEFLRRRDDASRGA